MAQKNGVSPIQNVTKETGWLSNHRNWNQLSVCGQFLHNKTLLIEIQGVNDYMTLNCKEFKVKELNFIGKYIFLKNLNLLYVMR